MTYTRMFQEYPVSLEKLSFFLYTGKIIQVLDFNNWHPLNHIDQFNDQLQVFVGQIKLCTFPGGIC